MDNKNKKNDGKVSNEKPIFLFPLDFKQAVAALLKVKPKPEEKKPSKKKNKPSN